MKRNLSKFLRNSMLMRIKVLLNASFSIGLCLFSGAENVISTGTTVRISSGTSIVSVGAFQIKNGGNVNNQGSVVLKADLDNQNTTVSNLGEGTFVLNGSSVQNVNGLNNLGSLIMNNYAGAMLNANTIVNGSLNLSLGTLTIGNNNLLLGNLAKVEGSPSVSSMVIATGSGEMRKSFDGLGSFTFPVGDNTDIQEYSPVTLNFSGGIFGASNYCGVNLANSAYPLSGGCYLKRYWNINQNEIDGFVCNAMFQYVAADVVGIENLIFCAKVLPGPTIFYDASNAVEHQLTAASIGSFGTFTGMIDSTQLMIPEIKTKFPFNLEVEIIPNPFDKQTQINVRTSFDGNISVEIFNLLGIKIKTIFKGDVSSYAKNSYLYQGSCCGPQQILICVIRSQFGTVIHKLIQVSR